MKRRKLGECGKWSVSNPPIRHTDKYSISDVFELSAIIKNRFGDWWKWITSCGQPFAKTAAQECIPEGGFGWAMFRAGHWIALRFGRLFPWGQM